MAARHPLVVDDDLPMLRLLEAPSEGAIIEADAPPDAPAPEEDAPAPGEIVEEPELESALAEPTEAWAEQGPAIALLEALAPPDDFLDAEIPPAPRGPGLRAYRGAFVLALLTSALIAATWHASTDVLVAIEQGAREAARYNTEQSRWVLTVAASALALLGFVVAWGRATMQRRPVRLADGRGRMAVGEVAAALRRAILGHEDVREAEVRVVNLHRHGLGVAARLRVGPRARIDEVIDAFEAAAEGLIEGRMGVPLDGPPAVDVHYDELDLRAGRLHV